MVLRDLGFDGSDLAVVPGSHVAPEQADSDLMRAIEAISGVGLEVPIISTSVITGNDPNGRQVLGIAGFMGIGLFRPGYWKFVHRACPRSAVGRGAARSLGLASIARAYNVAMAIHNATGDAVGATLWDVSDFLRGIDPRWVGYDFDPATPPKPPAVTGAGIAIRLALPQLKAVTVHDFTWNKDARAWKAIPCPLGEGMVDWRQFFTALARARFVGPMTIEVRTTRRTS